MAQEVFRLKDVKVVKEGRPILQVNQLVLNQGEVLGLIGPNGAGKSTLLLVLAALEKPTSGKIWFRGREVERRGTKLWLRRRLALVFQEPLLLDTTVYRNIAAGLRFRGVKEPAVRERVYSWLSALRIEDLVNRSARTLSGGEAQRVSLARALALQPEVLLLDEPFAALDSPTRSSLLEELHTILRSTELTAVFVTHDFRELPLLASRVVALRDGEVVQTGSPSEVLDHPADLRMAEFIGVANRLPATIVGRRDGLYQMRTARGLEICSRGNDVPAGKDKVTVCWRPEEACLIKAPGQNGSAGETINLWPALVRRTVPLGGQDRLMLDCEGQEMIALVTHRSFRELGLRDGSKAYLHVPPEMVHLIPV